MSERPMGAALPPLRAREEIPEDVVLAFMRRSNLTSRAILEMTVTEWKDGIDIQRPSHSTMEFARALFTAGQEWRDREVMIREFIHRQGEKLRTIEGSIAWRNGYGAALDAMTRVLDAVPAQPAAEPKPNTNNLMASWPR